MTNNDILRQIRYAFDFNDKKMMKLFELGGTPETREDISNWLKKEEADGYKSLYDIKLATFLNGFITDKRGVKKDGKVHPPEKKLNNNIILKKLKIALNLRNEDILEIFGLVRLRIGEHELSAFLRNPKQNQYRACKDQFLRNFLHGIQLKYRLEDKKVD